MLYFLVQMFPTTDASEEDGKTNKQKTAGIPDPL